MDTIRLERSPDLPGLATITLARPDKLNAINLRMHEELQQACAELQRDTATRVVILTGEGRAFSAGADVSATRSEEGTSLAATVSATDPLAQRYELGAGNRTAAALEGLDQVSIGAVNGLAVGGAVVFLACLDMRIADESAWFSIPEVDLDIPLTWNALPRLMRELGPARTRELVMTCDRFTSRQALEWGFLNHVVPDGEALPRARELASKLLAKDPLAIALTKSTTRALADQMVPASATHADREYLMLPAHLRGANRDA